MLLLHCSQICSLLNYANRSALSAKVSVLLRIYWIYPLESPHYSQCEELCTVPTAAAVAAALPAELWGGGVWHWLLYWAWPWSPI